MACIHRLRIPAILTLLVFTGITMNAQTVKLLTSGTKTSMRGLSVVNDKVVWASGSGGMVARSLDGGLHWTWNTVKGYEKSEFRDIEAFDDKNAVLMVIASPAIILRTTDGGTNWSIVFKDERKDMFLDAMEFSDSQNGIVLGDPINGRFFLARTYDGGKSWTELPEQERPQADSGEACFASSGTNIRKLTKEEWIFVTGGRAANIFKRNLRINVPIIQGTESTGANSIAVKDKKTYMIVGGDFNTKDATTKNCVYTNNGGMTWQVPDSLPHGYRSSVEYLGGHTWISCGLNGTDISKDDGKHFTWIGTDGYHVVRKAKKGKAVFFAGGGGRIGKLVD